MLKLSNQLIGVESQIPFLYRGLQDFNRVNFRWKSFGQSTFAGFLRVVYGRESKFFCGVMVPFCLLASIQPFD